MAFNQHGYIRLLLKNPDRLIQDHQKFRLNLPRVKLKGDATEDNLSWL